jgi:hypothetical protein
MNHPSESQEIITSQPTLEELCEKLQNIFGSRIQIVGKNIHLDGDVNYALSFQDGDSFSLSEAGEKIVKLAQSEGESAVKIEHLAGLI